MFTVTGNALLCISLWAIFVQEKNSITTDMWANFGFLAAAALGALLIDAQSLMGMFGRSLSLMGKVSGGSASAIVDLFGLQRWERTITIATITLNWLAAHGLFCSALKLGLAHPLAPNSIAQTSIHDLVSGDVLLNPLIRAWSWEAVYGMGCGLHLGTYFAVSAAHRAQFNVKLLVPKALCHGVLGLFLMALAGFFRKRPYSASCDAMPWHDMPCNGPSDGFWLVLTHLACLWLAYDQWYKLHPSADAKSAVSAEFQEGIRAFADEWRGWKPVSVFMLTTFLSVIFAYATPIYPIVLALTYWFHTKAHPMDRGWNKVLLILTITHQVLHYFVHSYRTLEDAPLLWCDKFCHFTYAVVAAQQFREKRELLSRDPLVKAFNYINIFVWIPGDLIALYIAGLHAPSDTYLKHMIGWGGYCLSTGTAMAYVNNDVEEDSAENSARRFIVMRKGVTGHGIQIFQALLFAVLYIVSTGGSAVWGNRIEYLYDYASHLYTGYGAL